MGEDAMDAPPPGYVDAGVFPERLWTRPNGMGVSRAGMDDAAASNWDIPMDEQAALDALPPLQRARLLAESGEAHAMSPYERMLLRRSNPEEAARLTWRGAAPEPSLEFGPSVSGDDFAGMFKANGDLAPPEQFLGRPLTPDHIWNDPRFEQRMAATADLEGIRTPEQRFHIAEWRERGGRAPNATS